MPGLSSVATAQKRALLMPTLQRYSSTLVLLSCLIAAPSCSHKAEPTKTSPMSSQQASSDPIPAENLMDEHISFQFGVYYLPKPTTDPVAELDVLLKDKVSAFRRVKKIERKADSPILAARIETNPKNAYAPPDLESLQYFGRGLNREQAEALQDTESVLIVDFAYPNDHVWDGLRSALELTLSLAQATGGLIWDEATREIFLPNVWKERRIVDWTEQVPDVSKHTVIHAYKKDEYEARVFDYIRRHRDGTSEGNETGKLIEKEPH